MTETEIPEIPQRRGRTGTETTTKEMMGLRPRTYTDKASTNATTSYTTQESKATSSTKTRHTTTTTATNKKQTSLSKRRGRAWTTASQRTTTGNTERFDAAHTINGHWSTARPNARTTSPSKPTRTHDTHRTFRMGTQEPNHEKGNGKQQMVILLTKGITRKGKTRRTPN
jgi:hypothetical protein